MINFIPEGDIFCLDNISSYAHGCNCAGTMGKGIALQFRQKFPEMYNEYRSLCRQGLFVPGDVFDYDYGKGHIYNLATQQTWRTGAKTGFIRASVLQMLTLAAGAHVSAVAMPAIGAGLGGLDWTEVKEVLCDISCAYPDIDLYVVEKYSSHGR